MAKKIKFKFLNFLFRSFAFWADKTGGWKVFVQPKLFFGALLITGLGVSSCTKLYTTCYDPIPPERKPEVTDSIATPDDDEPNVTCYLVGPPH